MKIVLKYVSLILILISLFAFSSMNSDRDILNFEATFGIEKHKERRYQRSFQRTLIIKNINNPEANDTIFYTEIILQEDETNDTDTIYVLKPSIIAGESMYFTTQPLRIQHETSMENIDEIVEVSNYRYNSSQCHKIIKDSEEMQDSLYVAYEVGDDIWKEKIVYLPYHRIFFDDESEVVFRPYEYFNVDDSIIYVSETFVIDGIDATIEVSRWCNSDGYPHVLENANSDDHYDPVGCE